MGFADPCRHCRDVPERAQSFGRDILPRGFMKPDDLGESGEWGIWYLPVAYTVGHFLKTLGPESKVWRFPTKQAAQQAILDRWIGSEYVARLIPNPKPLPEKSLT